MSHAIALSRRRWARRGRYLGDFVFSFLLAGTSHAMVGLHRLGRTCGRQIAMIIRRRRSTPANSSQQVSASTSNATGQHYATPQCNAASPFAPIAEKPNVRFSDVAGLEDAKREVMLRLVLPMRYPEKARALGIRRGGGLLLFGPPGTGKTLLAKAVASELNCPFYHIRPSDIMSGQVGQAEKNVHRLFQTVRSHSRAVLFFDELEAIVPSRRRNGSTIMARVISQFLSEVDGLDSGSGAGALLLIGATNEPDMLDQAATRSGRFDAKVYVGPPNAAAREQILRLCLNSRPIAEDVSLPRLVELTAGKTGAEIRNLLEQAADRAFVRSIQQGEQDLPAIAMFDIAPWN